MMRGVAGLAVALAAFGAAFALHIVGGATDQGWLFALAVGLIYLTAAGFPEIALWVAGDNRLSALESRVVLAVGFLAGSAFTLGAFWAANGRAFEAWMFAGAPITVACLSWALHRTRTAAAQARSPGRPIA